MKKTLLLIAVCLLVVPAAKAQNWDNWTYGVKGGVNLTNLTDDWNGKSKFSFHAGAFAEYRINSIVGIQSEFTYSRQGLYDKGNVTIAGENILKDVKVWARFNYFNIPVLAKLYVLDNLSVNLGPQFGILLNSKMKVKQGGTKITETISGSKGLDLSFAMGLSYNFGYRWMLDARYNLGLTDVNKHSDGKNSVFQLGLGYRF